jgi:ABC-type nitrate/sulfonate/bicarbonate transport system substrate-binding protein
MGDHTRRKFLAGTGAAATVGLAGCSAILGGGGTVGEVDTVLPNSIYLPWADAGLEQGLFEEAGVNLNVEFKGFGAYSQSVGNDVSVGAVPLVPYISNVVQGDDYVIFGTGQGAFLGINGLYVRADSEYESISDLEGERIGVWSWGSSTVQSFQALIANQTGLNLRQDFETTTAAPPALKGLLDDGEVDAIIEISGLSIALQADDNYRRLAQLNELWIEESGHPLAITMWFA